MCSADRFKTESLSGIRPVSSFLRLNRDLVVVSLLVAQSVLNREALLAVVSPPVSLIRLYPGTVLRPAERTFPNNGVNNNEPIL
jgi:hypothetical protein